MVLNRDKEERKPNPCYSLWSLSVCPLVCELVGRVWVCDPATPVCAEVTEIAKCFSGRCIWDWYLSQTSSAIKRSQPPTVPPCLCLFPVGKVHSISTGLNCEPYSDVTMLNSTS